MRVAEAMSTDYLTTRPEEGLRQAAGRMVDRWVGSAIVEADPGSAPGILTERDVVEAVGAGTDIARAGVVDHYTAEAKAAAPDWSLERAAAAMSEGEFRHLVVAEGERTVGVISMRDIVRSWMSERWRHPSIQIREAMTRGFLLLSRTDTLTDAARGMLERGLGAAVVEPPKRNAPPGIVTDRELLRVVGTGGDPGGEQLADHLSMRMTFSAPDWSLKQATEAMSRGGFQHVVVVDGGGTVGVISMRDIVRRLLDQRSA